MIIHPEQSRLNEIENIRKALREIDEKEKEKKLPAEPDDQMKTILQIDDVKRLTVDPDKGIMRLPVGSLGGHGGRGRRLGK